MKTWPLQEAETHFSEMLEACEEEGPQLVSREGKAAAVQVPLETWSRLMPIERPSLKALLLADEPRFDDLPIPERGRASRRRPVTLD